MLSTHNTCIEYLPQDQALIIINSLLPVFAYIFEKTAYFETRAKVNYYKKELEKNQATLKMLDKTKSGFIAVAAHELKTPLTLVEGYTAMLRDLAKANDLSKHFDIYFDGILNGTKRLQSIVSDMIDVTLIESNLLKLNFQPMWINRLFESLLLELKSVLSERKISIHLNDFDGYKLMNYGDQEKILQVFRNILLNAIKFTPDGGKIEINGRKLPGFIETTITDSGIGIEIEDQQLIFEKFSKVGDVSLHSSGKSKYKGGGPGLGLHIAKGIVESHGGSIWVESPGYDEVNYPGSTFHILLPLRNAAPEKIN
jgi:signal transduction histidine kinase